MVAWQKVCYTLSSWSGTQFQEKDGWRVKKLTLLTLFVLLCALLAACSGSTGGTGPCTADNLRMGPSTFCTDSISIPKGSTITFVDDPGNGAVHILAIGTNGQQENEKGAPDFGGAAGKSLNAGDKWTTQPWNTPGTYHVTCTVHPVSMNLTVTVTG
jgi:plastocyanin